MIRPASFADIPQMQLVRNSVKENSLSDPRLVPDRDYEIYLAERGSGWVSEEERQVVGFAIIDLLDRNVWALFLDPAFERQGIGRKLHDTMINWYFQQTREPVWLGTSPNTRAEQFYRAAGWKEIGIHGKGEVKFEMTAENWLMHSQANPPL